MRSSVSSAADYFRNRPAQWGLRGDIHLWEEMEDIMATVPSPSTPAEFEQLLHKLFRQLVGEPPKEGRNPFVDRYDTGGMSSGMISGDFWLSNGFPLLVRSYLDQPADQPGASGLTAEAEQVITACALRFDGYAYARAAFPGDTAPLSGLAVLLEKAQRSGRLSTRPIENFAANFHLHRSFHGHGALPARFHPLWYDMAFYYLQLYRLPTPAIHRHELAAEWDRRPKGSAERAAARLRSLLRHTW